MELKRILAKDLRAATEKAVSLYGADALVVSHEQVNGQTEVIVAVDLEPRFDPYAAVTDNSAEPSQAVSVTPGSARVFQPEELTTETFRPIEPKIHRQEGFAQTFGQAFDPAAAKKGAGRSAEKSGAAAIAIEAGPAPTGPVADDRERLRAREIVDLVRQEMAALRREIRLQQRMGPWAAAGLTPLGQQLDGLLECLGASSSMRALLVEEIQEEPDIEAALKKAEEVVRAGLSSPQVGGPLQGWQVVMGPSGSGKTLTVARLAQQAIEAWGAEKVAVLSWSDSRLGAWAQIQMTCAKLGVDCFRVHDAGLVSQMRQELGDRQCVIIDTPGVGMTGHTEQLAGLLPQAQFQLVLPADTSAAHATRLLAAYSWASLIITKVDEACQSWGLLQALGQHPVPLYAYASDGPGLQAHLPMNISVLARLAVGQLRDQVAQDLGPAKDPEGLSASTMGQIFMPTQARLSPRVRR